MKIKDMPPLTGEQSNINIAPLIDIVFILLIFFMVTTTFNKDFWLELERPEAQSATARQTETL
ncbi:MAG: biopolymer transporter ExbD, partial [Myxococcota bacterium]|nr:biopolymer transporter ExbD [Myxococcota bacterium]